MWGKSRGLPCVDNLSARTKTNKYENMFNRWISNLSSGLLGKHGLAAMGRASLMVNKIACFSN